MGNRNQGDGLRCELSILLALCVAMLAVSGPALAHTDPAGNSGSGIGGVVDVFFAGTGDPNNGGAVGPAVPGGTDLTTCETIWYQATLSWAGGNANSVEGGDWSIWTPDGVEHDVTPLLGIPCLGEPGVSQDDAINPGKGQCSTTTGSITSVYVSYTVNPAHVGTSPNPQCPAVAGQITACAILSDAFAHFGVDDDPNQSAAQTKRLPVAPCVDGDFCSDTVCVEGARFGLGDSRLGACVTTDVGATQCPDPGNYCDDVVCDEASDSCITSDSAAKIACDAGDTNYCSDQECDETANDCVVTDSAAKTACDAGDTNYCSDQECDETANDCVVTDSAAKTACDAGDTNYCSDQECDETANDCVVTDSAAKTACDAGDTNYCSDQECDETANDCVVTDSAAKIACDAGDTNFCSEQECDEAADTCAVTDTSDIVCPDPGNFCDDVACNESLGECVTTPVDVGCDEECEECDETADDCVDLAPQPLSCQPHVGCRITGGGWTTAPDGTIIEGEPASIGKATFGGQVGAPCGCSGCFDEFDHIQGSWQHSRKSRRGSFHAFDYNSLICGCDGVFDGELCNPDGGDLGPQPRPAPANMACWTGVADYNRTNGRRTTRVAFRVEVEDRSEPGAGKNLPDDVYRLRIWIPDGIETAEGLADDVCCTVAEPDVRPPDVDDGGDLKKGNIQIHPALGHTEDLICPVPRGSCEELN